jgi:hypothetical protein
MERGAGFGGPSVPVSTRGCGLGPGIGSNTTGRIPANASFAGHISPFGPAPAMTTSVADCDLWFTSNLRTFEHVKHVASQHVCLGWLIDLVCGCWGDTEFGRDRLDGLLRDVEVYLAVGGEVRSDVSLVVPLCFIMR